jgi:hypothetical protein
LPTPLSGKIPGQGVGKSGLSEKVCEILIDNPPKRLKTLNKAQFFVPKIDFYETFKKAIKNALFLVSFSYLSDFSSPPSSPKSSLSPA